MEHLTNLFKALSDETRLRIVHALSYRDLCVCEMTTLFDEPQPKISKHLSKLKDLGLVQTARQDKYMVYTLNQDQTLLRGVMDLMMNESSKDSLLLRDQTHLNTPALWACIGVERSLEATK